MIAPLLLPAGDSVRMALGSGGGKRIRIALLHVISNTVDSVCPHALRAKRRACTGDGQCIQVEPRFAETALAVLAQRWPVNRTSTSEVYFSGVHIAVPDGKDADNPRSGGCTVTFA